MIRRRGPLIGRLPPPFSSLHDLVSAVVGRLIRSTCLLHLLGGARNNGSPSHFRHKRASPSSLTLRNRLPSVIPARLQVRRPARLQVRHPARLPSVSRPSSGPSPVRLPVRLPSVFRSVSRPSSGPSPVRLPVRLPARLPPVARPVSRPSSGPSPGLSPVRLPPVARTIAHSAPSSLPSAARAVWGWSAAAGRPGRRRAAEEAG